MTCSRCGRQFDAFEALECLGREWSSYDINHRMLRHEIKDLTERREALRREVKNLQAQLRRLQAK